MRPRAISRGLFALLVLAHGCAARREVALRSAVMPGAEVQREADARVPAPLPAGRWALDDLDRTTCVDCPTPRFAVAWPAADLNEARSFAVDERVSAPGYPFVLARGELGIELNSPFTVIVGLYARQHDAERASVMMGGRSMVLEETRFVPTERFVLEIVSEAPAYALEDLRISSEASGDDLIGWMDVRPGASPRCVLPEGTLLEALLDHVHTLPGAEGWIEIRCPEGAARGGVAFVRPSHTDLRRSVEVGEDGRVRTTQVESGACGVLFFRRIEQHRDGSRRERTLTSAPSCSEDPPPTEQDPWDACGGELERCVERAAAAVHASDRFHARRLLGYACRFGSARACVSLADAEDAREGLGVLLDACERLGQLACDELDSRLRRIDPSTIEGEPGDLERAFCLRGHERWCEALERSTVCDRDGCG